MTSQEDIQRIARLSDMNRQRLAQIEDQVVRLNSVIEEHTHVSTSLKNIQEGTESALIPLGAGIHLPTPLNNKQTTLVDIGSGILLEKTPKEASTILEIRIGEIQVLIDSLTTEFQKTESKIEELNNQLSKAVEEHNKDIGE